MSHIKRTLMIVECPTPQRNPTLDELERLGCPLHVLYLRDAPKEFRGWGDTSPAHSHRLWDSLNLWQKLVVIKEICLARNFHTVVCFGYRGLPRVTALITSRINRSRIVVRSDSNQLEVLRQSKFKRSLKRLYLRILIPRSTVAWCIGTQNEIFWSTEVGLKRLVRIPYEVPILPGGHKSDDLLQRQSDPDRIHILYVGRLVPYKHVEDAISAFKMLTNDTQQNWVLTIVGDGPERNNLELISRGDSRIVFTGSIPYSKLGSVFMDADVLVIPSDGEAWGLVVNEALGFGLYVIASDLVGCAVDLIDTETGQTYSSTDVSQLSKAMASSASHLNRFPRGPKTNTASLMRESLDTSRN
jgi:glycosyltransferase involved in cell wall biosynthesis